MTAETTQSPETQSTETPSTETKPTETQPSETKPTETQPSETKPTETQPSERQSSANRDTVYIGKKPLMAYVTSTLIQLASLKSVSIKARGLTIGRAVDVAQIISRKTENAGYEIGRIAIGSEVLESKDGKSRNVSTIDIEVKRK
ncbi:MAG: DNA/RNA-binding protein Alba [Nitrosopumilales archaeon]|nr:MAG: DNA/RNA-binding protein Alba [Nitrosopumilales archaeon]